MNQIDVTINIPEMWGGNTFKKIDWGNINLLVGANGTGKSLFAEQLKNQLSQKGFSVRLLNAERLSGFEKMDYNYFTNGQFNQGLNISNFDRYKSHGESYGLSTSAFVILKERLDIRILIEAFLSDIFKKTIRLVEEGGFLKPKMQNIKGGNEYGLKEQECHGLKELITLLTFLYDDSKECLILDEPELHLHPQFQSFFLTEIRRLAGNPKNTPGKKLFFLITHSPYFLDLKTIDDLKSVIVFQNKTKPSFIDEIEGQDEYIIKKFLPRFNTHHKQFFFSNNPVFVEGYTDQQLITLIYDKLGKNIGASGSCVVDVGGKDELGVFYKLCEKLNINPIIIADLDALFKGKLREVLCSNDKANKYMQDKGIGESISQEIGDLDVKLKEIGIDLTTKTSDDIDIMHIIDHLKGFKDIIQNIEAFRLSVLLGIIRHKSKLNNVVSSNYIATLNMIPGRLEQLINAASQCNINFIKIGELEHYYTQSTIDYLNITNKDKAFHSERDFVLESTVEQIIASYSDLIIFLETTIPYVVVNLFEHHKYQLIEWVQKIQTAIVRGEIEDIEHLKQNARVNYARYKQIVEIVDFNMNKTDSTFVCRVKLPKKLSSEEIEFDISEQTTAFNFTF